MTIHCFGDTVIQSLRTVLYFCSWLAVGKQLLGYEEFLCEVLKVLVIYQIQRKILVDFSEGKFCPQVR